MRRTLTKMQGIAKFMLIRMIITELYILQWMFYENSFQLNHIFRLKSFIEKLAKNKQART